MHPRQSSALVLRPLLLAAAAALAAGATGCSSGPGDDPAHGASGAGTAAAPVAAVAPPAADEASRVQAYLDARYLATDVKHSFHSAVGDDIDCVDFASEPSVRALLAQGSTVDELVEPFQRDQAARAAKTEAAPRSPEYFQGDRDEAGQIRSCPSGTVAHVRLTAAEISAAGGLDAYLASYRKVAPTRSGGLDSRIHAESTVPDAGGYLSDTGNYAWVQDWYSQAGTLSVQGGTSTMTIAAPSLTTASAGHSVAQVWLTGADHPGEERQTLEAGWIATPGATNGVQQPHLFIFTTSDAYVHGCFYGTTESGCPTWVPNTSATLALGGTLTPSVQGGTQHELTISITHLRFLCRLELVCPVSYLGWAINAQIDGGPTVELGYYTNASYSSQGTAGLASQGDDFVVGGEVYDVTQSFGAPPAVTMGEGAMTIGLASYGSTAYHRNFSYEDGTYTQVLSPSEVDYTNSEYLYNISAAPGSTAWTTYFYYGDWAPFHIIFPNPIKL